MLGRIFERAVEDRKRLFDVMTVCDSAVLGLASGILWTALPPSQQPHNVERILVLCPSPERVALEHQQGQ